MHTQHSSEQQTSEAFAALTRAAAAHEAASQALSAAAQRRNDSIRTARAAEIRVAEIVAVTGVSTQRVHQILNGGRGQPERAQ